MATYGTASLPMNDSSNLGIIVKVKLKRDGRADVIDALRRMSASAPAGLTSDEIDEEIRACRESRE